MALFHSSVIVTTAAVDTRTRDQVVFSYTPRPQAMSIYLQFVETGAVLLTSFPRILVIGTLSTTTAYIAMLVHSSGVYYLSYRNGITTTERSSFLGAGAVVGSSVELMGTLTSGGVIQMYQSINGGTATSGSAGTASILPVAWAAQTGALASGGASNSAFGAYRNVCVEAGGLTREQKRVRAGTD